MKKAKNQKKQEKKRKEKTESHVLETKTFILFRFVSF